MEQNVLQARRRCPVSLVLPLLTAGLTVVVVATARPVLDTDVGQQPTFIPVMLALVGCFDVLSIVMLVAQFRDSGELRALRLACAFAFSLVTLLGWAAAFPGVLGQPAPLASVPSTAPWLWIAWHAGLPVLLALAVVPLPRWVHRRLAAVPPVSLQWGMLIGTVAVSALLVAVVVAVSPHLPVIISGTDVSAMTWLTGPVIVPVVGLAAAVTIALSWRCAGAEKWAGLAAAAALGDVLLTMFSFYRYSGGWYAGRTMTIVTAGVVLVALLREHVGVKRLLVREGERLRGQLDRVDRLERLQSTLLGHLPGGVVMQSATGAVVASNQAAADLLGLRPAEVSGAVALDLRGRALLPDGTPWGERETPSETTARTGIPQRNAVVGLHTGGPDPRWLRLSTEPVRDQFGNVQFVVTSVGDVTQEHGAALAAAHEYSARYDRVRAVLDGGGPAMVFQPIVELGGGRIVGMEALARFPGDPARAPDRWFADAEQISPGIGVELELSAVRAALHQMDVLPAGAYLSVNVSPATVIAPGLRELLSAGVAARVILELTEHTGVASYGELLTELDRLRAMGVRVAVDDAGSGYATLQHVLNLRPDVIKLDRALVTGIDTDAARRALAGALLTFARDIGATVVAEGIENAREQTVLRRLGVRYGQGYHLGRPAPHLPVGSEDMPDPVTAVANA